MVSAQLTDLPERSAGCRRRGIATPPHWTEPERFAQVPLGDREALRQEGDVGGVDGEPAPPKHGVVATP